MVTGGVMTKLVSILDKLKKSSANIVSIGRIFFAFIAIYLVIAYQIDESTSLFVTKAMKETSGNAYYWAIICTILAFALDGLDGYLARKFKVSSKLGATLDIMGDRIVEYSYWVLFAVNRHIFTGRATRQFEIDFVNYPTDKFELLIKKCLNGDRCNDGIIKTVKRIISR